MWLLAPLALFGLPGATSAQEVEGAAEQAAPPAMTWVYIEHVKPAMAQEYEAATKEMIGLLEENAVDPEAVQFIGISGLELGYAYAIPIQGFAGIDKAYTAWESAFETVGREKVDELTARTDKAIDHAESYVIVLRPDLSYLPETVALDPEQPYRKYYWWYLTAGMTDDFEAVAREFVELYGANGIENGWRIYQALSGSDLPMYLTVERAAGPYEYAARDREVTELIGDQASKLFAKALKTARRIKSSEGWIRPDLSYPRLESGGEE
jgi:hypothetical protein